MAEIPAKLRKQRRQFEVQVAHEPGVVREIGFQAPSNDTNGTKLDGLIILNREGSNKLIYLIRSLDSIPVCSGDTSGFDDGWRRQGGALPDGLPRGTTRETTLATVHTWLNHARF